MTLLEEAATRGFPADGGAVEVLPAPSGACDAVLTLMGKTVVAAGITERWVAERVPRDDLSGPMRPDFVAALAEELGTSPGSIDVLLAAPGYASRPIVEMSEIAHDEAGVGLADRFGSDVRSYADRESGGTISLGHGLDGRLDLLINLSTDSRFIGRGWKIVEAARTFVPPEDFLFASIPPGNAGCLRAALGAGFTPIGAEVLFSVRPAS